MGEAGSDVFLVCEGDALAGEGIKATIASSPLGGLLKSANAPS